MARDGTLTRILFQILQSLATCSSSFGQHENILGQAVKMLHCLLDKAWDPFIKASELNSILEKLKLRHQKTELSVQKLQTLVLKKAQLGQELDAGSVLPGTQPEQQEKKVDLKARARLKQQELMQKMKDKQLQF